MPRQIPTGQRPAVAAVLAQRASAYSGTMEEGTSHGSAEARTTAQTQVRRGITGKLFGQDLLHVALLVGLAVWIGNAMLLPAELINDPDIWWHLADARTLTATHHFIHVEPYSFTVAGQPWVNPEWLSELPYWAGYSLLGLRGVHLVALLGLCANLLFVYFRSAWKAGHQQAALWTSVLAFFLMTGNSGARTIVIAYLAMNAEMAILEAAERGRKSLLWLLPPLFCVWINLHGSWIFGLGFLGLYIGCGLVNLRRGLFEQRAFSAADRNRLVFVLLACLVFLFVNPYGWRLIWNPFDMQLHQRLVLSLTDEWQPLGLSSSTGIAALVAIGASVVTNLVSPRKWKLYELAFLGSAWYFAFAHQRFAYLACIVSMPFLTSDLARSFYGTPSTKTIPAVNGVFAAVILGAIVYTFPSQSSIQKGLQDGLPLQSIAALQPTWRTFTDYSLGGMMAFDGKADFVDSRNDTFEHHGILEQYFEIENLQNPYALLDSNRIDHVLTHANSGPAFALEHSPHWLLVSQEGSGANVYELFARTAGE
jgi:hypothetical protein